MNQCQVTSTNSVKTFYVSDSFEIKTEHELQAYIYNKTKTTYLGWTFKQFGNLLLPSILGIQDNSMCSVCPLIVNALIEERKLDMTDVQLEGEALYFCTLFKIEDEKVCQGVIELNTVSEKYEKYAKHTS